MPPMTYAQGVKLTGPPANLTDDDEADFSVKDVFDCPPQATSRSMHDAFKSSGWSIRDFFKTPGRNFFCLQVHRTAATSPANMRQARQVVADILETVGLWPHGDDLLVYQTGDRLVIGLVAALEDVTESAGFTKL
jgi:hypothetical protein